MKRLIPAIVRDIKEQGPIKIRGMVWCQSNTGRNKASDSNSKSNNLSFEPDFYILENGDIAKKID